MFLGALVLSDKKKSVNVNGKKIFITGNSDSINYKKIASLSTSSYGCVLEKRLHAGIDFVIVGNEAGEELDEAEGLGIALFNHCCPTIFFRPSAAVSRDGLVDAFLTCRRRGPLPPDPRPRPHPNPGGWRLAKRSCFNIM